jgi:hypothetical protein
MPFAALAFAAMLALAAAALRVGFVSDDTVTLWAGAIAAGDGEISLGRLVSVYPSIPFLATALMEVLTPGGSPTPALVAAALMGTIASYCLVAFRARGLGIAAALVVTVLIAFHPALLRAAIAGPADMFLAAFLVLLAKGLYDLRAQSAAPEVMTVAMALLGLTFSHPIGAAVAVASVPFLLLAVRPSLIANSALSVVVALVFPVIFSVCAFVYVSWVFPGSGWSFFTAPAASLAGWAAGMTRLVGEGPSLTLAAGVTVTLALVLAAPVAVLALVAMRHRRPLVVPALALVAATIVAAVMAVAAGVFGEPAPLLVAAPVLAATLLIRTPIVQERRAAVFALLLLGWFGGAAGVLLVDPRIAAHLGDLVNGGAGDRDRLDALNLGRATGGRDGVLVDTLNAPAVVLGRGTARGLFAPQGEGFALAMLFAKIDAPLVAVPDPLSAAGAQDQLNKTFPSLYRFGAAGYRLLYQNTTWRLYERASPRVLAND